MNGQSFKGSASSMVRPNYFQFIYYLVQESDS